MIGTRTLSRNRQVRLAAVLILGVLYAMIRMGAGAPTAHAATQGPTCHGQPATIASDISRRNKSISDPINIAQFREATSLGIGWKRKTRRSQYRSR